MVIDITEKGERYLDRLGRDFPGNLEDPQVFDFTVLVTLSQGGPDTPDNIMARGEEFKRGEGEILKSSIRRLFEAGYLEIVN